MKIFFAYPHKETQKEDKTTKKINIEKAEEKKLNDWLQTQIKLWESLGIKLENQYYIKKRCE